MKNGTGPSPELTSAHTGTRRRVMVLNQFALPREQPGGTRHIDLFSRLTGWTPLIIAGDRNHQTGERFNTKDTRFQLLTIPSSTGSPLDRLRSWIAYTGKSIHTGLKTSDTSLVYASSPHPLTIVAGILIAKKHGLPLIIEVRDLWPDSIASFGYLKEGGGIYRLLKLFERWSYLRANAIVSVSPGWASHFIACGVPSDRIYTISNGATIPRDTDNRNRDLIRKKYKIDGFTAVYAGSHGKANALDYILDAASECRQINFLLVGSGPERSRLMHEARVRHLPNVRFLEPLPKRQIPELISACDIGIHCIQPADVLLHGMSPNKFFDYWACGLPVASNAGAAARSLAPPELHPLLGGPDSLASTLDTFYNFPERLQRDLGARGREHLADHYTTAVSAQNLEVVLNTTLAAHQANNPQLSNRV